MPLPINSQSNPYDIIGQGKLEKELWQESNIKEVHAIFRGQTSQQLNLFTNFKNRNKQLLELNHQLIMQLKKSL